MVRTLTCIFSCCLRTKKLLKSLRVSSAARTDPAHLNPDPVHLNPDPVHLIPDPAHLIPDPNLLTALMKH